MSFLCNNRKDCNPNTVLPNASQCPKSQKTDTGDQEDDTKPIIGEKRSKTSTMVVRGLPPTPLVVSTLSSCKINYLVVLLFLAPSILYSCPNLVIPPHSRYLQEMLYKATQSSIARNDIILMAWTHFLVAVAGAFTPVLHLLCDDWISSLGLETLRSFGRIEDWNRFYRTKELFYKWVQMFRKCDPVHIPNTQSYETDPSARKTTHEYTFTKDIKLKIGEKVSENIFDEYKCPFSQNKNYKHSNQQKTDKNNDVNICMNHKKVERRNLSFIPEMEESTDIKNSSDTKNLAYDDLIELKDDLHSF